MKLDKRRIAIAVVALLFLGGAVLFSRLTDHTIDTMKGRTAAEDDFSQRDPIVYPRQRALRPSGKPPLADQRATGRNGRDPLQSALLAPNGGGAVFFEVNAIRHSDLVDKILRCRKDEAFDEIARMRDEIGIDPTEDVDRMGIGTHTLAVSGFFDELKLPPQLGAGTSYGDEARIYKMDGNGKPGEGTGYLARVGNDVMLMGESEEELRASIDRIEGCAAPAALPAQSGQSEVYGTIGKELLSSLFEGESSLLSKTVTDVVTGGSVRMNVGKEVSMSLDMTAKDAESGKDVAKMIGGGLAALRRQAEVDGEHELAWLLEQARVDPSDDARFNVDLAVPGDVVLKALGCDKDGSPLARDGALPTADAPAKPVEAEPKATVEDAKPAP